MLAKLFEHSEFFVSVGKYCRLASNLAIILIIRINLYCKVRICGNDQSYENKIEKIEGL